MGRFRNPCILGICFFRNYNKRTSNNTGIQLEAVSVIENGGYPELCIVYCDMPLDVKEEPFTNSLNNEHGTVL